MSDYIQEDFFESDATRAGQIFAAFKEFHLANPGVWALFKQFALTASDVTEHYSAKALIERIRWEMEIETNGDEVRINNNFTAYYARLFHVDQPRLGSFFRNRKRTSEEGAANERDLQVHNSGPPGPESDLTRELRGLL